MNRPDIPAMTNELIQHITVEDFISMKWVKHLSYIFGLFLYTVIDWSFVFVPFFVGNDDVISNYDEKKNIS